MKYVIAAMFLAVTAISCGDSGGTGGAGSGVMSGGAGGGSAAVVVAAPAGPLTVLADTVLLLHFDGNVTDASGRHTANSDNTASDITTAAFGSASRKFTGAQYLDFLNAADFDMGANNFEIQWWMRTTSSAAAYIFGAHAASCAGNTNTISADVNAAVAGQIRFMINSGGTNMAATGNIAVNDGAWHAIDVTKVGTVVTLKIDGVVQNVLPSISPVPPPSANFTIGRAGQCAGMYYTGDIDEFRINKN